MFFLLGGNNEKKARKAERKQHRKMGEMTDRAREIFMAGRFPVVTTDEVEGRRIAKVLGLVCCRGFDSEEAFFARPPGLVSSYHCIAELLTAIL